MKVLTFQRGFIQILEVYAGAFQTSKIEIFAIKFYFLTIVSKLSIFDVFGAVLALPLDLFLYDYQNWVNVRSSHRSCFVKQAVLKNLINFTGKHLVENSTFNNVNVTSNVTSKDFVNPLRAERIFFQ